MAQKWAPWDTDGEKKIKKEHSEEEKATTRTRSSKEAPSRWVHGQPGGFVRRPAPYRRRRATAPRLVQLKKQSSRPSMLLRRTALHCA